ncbi:hypothetical protein [Caldivirga sp.]|mgnify:CR=1 FL=1|uniref:hypothetical protein n=1 Tax=Caldivirga sp. TaxID=2080243 RepID=UPI0025C47696|nr:hypothetical protein [Caldivirga sp.]
MDLVVKAIMVIIVAIAVAYLLIYVAPNMLSHVTYGSNYSETPVIAIESKVPGIVHIDEYDGQSTEVNLTIIYTPLMPKPTVYYTVSRIGEVTYINISSATCPSGQFYPVYTCIVGISIYVPSSTASVSFKDSASAINLNIDGLRNLNLHLSASAITMKISNVSNASITIQSSEANISIKGMGHYHVDSTASSLNVSTPTNTCLLIDATSSTVSYPGNSIAGTGTINATKPGCGIELILDSISSSITIN